ncbi:hypothetical protein HK096_005341, partial [Nowakowskiella sp. JEL0078]
MKDCIIYKLNTLVPDQHIRKRLLDFEKGGKYSQSILDQDIKIYHNSKKILDVIFDNAVNLGDISSEIPVFLNETSHYVVVREIDANLYIPNETLAQNTEYFDISQSHQYEINPDITNFNLNYQHELYPENTNCFDLNSQLELNPIITSCFDLNHSSSAEYNFQNENNPLSRFQLPQQVEMNLGYYLYLNIGLP